MVELQTGHVFASLATTSTRPANAVRYRQLAREAYHAVIRFWPTLALQLDEDARLRSQLASLESKIDELAQLQRGASDNNGFTVDEGVAATLQFAFRP